MLGSVGLCASCPRERPIAGRSSTFDARDLPSGAKAEKWPSQAEKANGLDARVCRVIQNGVRMSECTEIKDRPGDGEATLAVMNGSRSRRRTLPR